MNKEIVKAMNRKEKKKNQTFQKWWGKNRYVIARIVFFPIWIVIVINQKIETALDKHNKWNEERANEILNYYIPRRAEWVEEEKELYFFDNGFGWSFHSAKKYLKRKDRRFWKINTGGWGYKMRTYLIKNFELEGFTKEVLNTDDSWTEINFKMN